MYFKITWHMKNQANVTRGILKGKIINSINAKMTQMWELSVKGFKELLELHSIK